MPKAKANGVEIEYETYGDPKNPTVLLINGLGSQMTRWPEPFCDKLAARGYHVVRFDNRDVGLSTWFKPGDAYRLDDMAADAIALLDTLGVAKAHIAGVSMGGMIAQLVVADYPDRVLSLTSVMSNTGAPLTPQPPPARTAPPPDPTKDFEGFIAHGVAGANAIGGSGYPWDPAFIRQRTIDEYRRAYNPAGFGRQLAAIQAAPDRTAKLGTIKVPTVVLHGSEDPLVLPAGGEATHKAIPGSELRIIEGMGHNLTPELYDIFVDAITAAASRA
jgi:pimeloyl-ACP methyl ester carboxylesterase